MNLNRILLILVVVLSLSSCVSLKLDKADYKDVPAAEKAITTLKDGVLIARFYSKEKTLKEIDRLLKIENINNREDLINKRDETIKDRKRYYNKMYPAVLEKYSFGKVLFIKDSDYKRLLSGESENIFLNDKMEYDPSIKLETDEFYVMAIGNLMDQIQILEKNGKRIAAPFPSKIWAPWNEPAWIRNLMFLRPEIPFTVLIESLNNSFNKYYEKVINN